MSSVPAATQTALNEPYFERSRRSERAVGKYQVSERPRLTTEQEEELVKGMQNGDLQARNQLIESHMKLVLKIARSYMGRGLEFNDLVQAGVLALFKATEHYELMPGKEFADYAIPFINGYMKSAIKSKAGSVSVPGAVMERKGKLVDISDQLAQEIGHQPTITELAGESGYSVEEIEEALTASRVGVSLDQPVVESVSGSGVMVDLVPDQNLSLRPLEVLIDKNNQAGMESLLTTLTDEERRALELRFGLEDGQERRLHVVGRLMQQDKSPKSHVGYEMYAFRQIQSALKKLRKDPQTRPFLFEYLEYIDEHYPASKPH
ncbi:MAG: sigma-70 family RNA polymerase sigma factor [Candidatus Saccharimonadales bacterium]